MTQLRVEIGGKLEHSNHLTEIATQDGQVIQVGKLSIPYCHHAVTPATVATLRARGVYQNGDDVWINSDIDK